MGLVSGASDWAKACGSSRSYKRKLNSSTKNQQRREKRQGKCDIFSGIWVYDNVSYPLYEEGGCPYMSDQLACTKHGRPDVEYQRMRWQPHACNLKRYGNFFFIFTDGYILIDVEKCILVFLVVDETTSLLSLN